MRLASLAIVVSLAACGSSAAPALGDDPADATAGAPDAGGGEVDAGAADAADDPTNPIAWTHVATLPAARLPWAVLYDGDVWALQFDALVRVHLATADVAVLPVHQPATGFSHDQGAVCVSGSTAYFLGGGGNGVFGDWNVFDVDRLDLSGPAWLPPQAAPIVRHELAAVTAPGGCALLGGDQAQHADMGTRTTIVVDTAAWTWGKLANLPQIVSNVAATAAGTTLFAAGGRCGGPECPGTSTSVPIATIAHAWTLDASDAQAMWQAAPDLPRAVHSAGAVAHEGRFYVLGGLEDGMPPYGSHREVVSWARGEGAFRVDGRLPAGATTAVGLSDGARLYAVVASDAGAELWAWTP